MAGIGLAPVGLYLFAASILLSIIDLRRFRAANPGLIPDADVLRDSPWGKTLFRYSAIGTGLLLGLSVAALVLVNEEQARAAAIGPALIAGVATLIINWRLKVALSKIDGAADPGDDSDESPPT